MMKPVVDLMLDSGVFSAWTHNETINLVDYIRYLNDHKHLLFSYVSVDLIPGRFGQTRTHDQVQESAKVSYRNQQIMKDAGLEPIPVFHQCEDFVWLEKMMLEEEPYIGLAPRKDMTAKQNAQWLDECFSILSTSDGSPIVKTHGFGFTNPRLLLRYPFFSIDSTAWSVAPGYGEIIVPAYTDNEPDYSRPSSRVAVSDSSIHDRVVDHRFERLSEREQDHVIDFVERIVGVSMPHIRYDANLRRVAVLGYFRELSLHLPAVRFKGYKGGFFFGRSSCVRDRPAIRFDHVRVMHATVMNTEAWSHLMNTIDANTRLLSYYDLRHVPYEKLERYVMTGTLSKSYQRRKPKLNWGTAHKNWRALRLYERVNGVI